MQPYRPYYFFYKQFFFFLAMLLVLFVSQTAYYMLWRISHFVCCSIIMLFVGNKMIETWSSNWYCRLWETFLVFLVFYTAWVSPFEFGFLEKPRGPLAVIDNVVNAFFAIDIALTFFVAYLDESSYLLIDNPKQIAWRYTRTWLAFDVISTIPSEFARSILPPPLQTYGYFNLLRLWRLRRVSKMFAR